MLIRMSVLEKIKSKEIMLVFRRWHKPGVKAGSTLKTPVGILEVTAIDIVDSHEVTDTDARKAGYPDLAALFKEIDRRDGTLYRIEIAYIAEDPRLQLRESDQLSAQDISNLRMKLARLDAASKHGYWTIRLLKAIEQNPMLSAEALAGKTGYEKEWLKLNVRKLKNLGLTISHNPGYTLSPRGIAFLKTVE